MSYGASPNNSVRRRLFPADETTEEACIDNFKNILQEEIARDRLEKKQKWNFDFEKEVPLEGTYEWVPGNDSNEWYGREINRSETRVEDDEAEDAMAMKKKNETTPKSKNEELPLLCKRRRDNKNESRSVRRNINFE